MIKLLSGIKSRFVLDSPFILLPVLALCAGFAQADIYRSLDPNTPTTFTNIRPTEGRWELYRKEKPAPVREAPAYDARRFTVDSRTRFASHIQAAAAANNIDAALIRAVISVESSYNPSAVSRAGAVGLMQLMPETAKRYDVTDSHDPEQNIRGGARYLRDLLQMFNYDLHLAIAAYNAGEQAVMKWGNRIPPYRETMAYVPKVMKFYQRYRAGYASASAASSGHSAQRRMPRATQKNSGRSRVSRTYIAKPG